MALCSVVACGGRFPPALAGHSKSGFGQQAQKDIQKRLKAFFLHFALAKNQSLPLRVKTQLHD
jgi:hypothetical protein